MKSHQIWVAIDPKLKKLSTGKQNLRGKHLPPVLIGLRKKSLSPSSHSSVAGIYFRGGILK